MELPPKARFILSSLLPQRKAPDPRYAIPAADRDLSGKTIVFTGGTDGMGRSAVGMLHGMGANVVVLGRNPAKGDDLVREVSASGGPGAISFEACDLASMKSVRECAARVLAENAAIDVLVNCAGANFTNRSVTEDGFELHWAVNYLGPFLLTNLLLERLRASAPARIVNLASASEAIGHIDFDDLQHEKAYSVMKAYGQAKLAITMFTIDLARRLEGTGVLVNALNPGFIKSNLLRETKGWEASGRIMMKWLASPAEVGGDRIVRLAISSEYEGVTGKFVYEDAIRPPNPETQDADVVAKLMRLSEQAVGIAS